MKAQYSIRESIIQGCVIDKVIGSGIENVSIIIGIKKYGTISTQTGSFEICAGVWDRLEFVCLGYIVIDTIVTQAMIEKIVF